MTEAPRKKKLAFWARWIHTYVSLFGFAALVFFSVTGLTLNHAEWFEHVTSEREITEPLPAGFAETGADDSAVILKLIDRIREQESLSGAIEDVMVEDGYAEVSLQGPGYVADVTVDLEAAEYSVFETRRGFWSVANDLHKARHTSGPWSVLVDAAALVLTLSGLTGVWLLWYLKKIRWRGIAVSVFGLIALLSVAAIA